ncbi:HpcH/HpaI aldolase/citrate lyase family protein [Ochrobactrum teleogrylli]|uniref:HpcH/HpaI aldolase/citrate lyase family protein n=1 Tax=Ochrobactrum teleogrylli TaxID=2479765 RepID=UPI0038506645
MSERRPFEIARSFLFVPGHRPERFAKAAATNAHQIIIDLEDAVGPAEKDAARGHVVEWLAQRRTGLVRINAADTQWFEDDIRALADIPNLALVLPKAEPETVQSLAALAPKTQIIALVETVAGLLHLGALARMRSVRRIAFGHLDFGADARIPGTGGVLDMVRFQIALHARGANLPMPIDGVTVELTDEAVIAADVARGRELGFGAKLCIHPKQVDAVNLGFAPSNSERDWATRVIAALEAAGGAAVQVDGKMIDKPMMTRAAAILAEAA